MADSTDEESLDSDYSILELEDVPELDDFPGFKINNAYYGVKDEDCEGVGLPNFRDACEDDAKRVLDIIDANHPPGLRYRGYTRFGSFTFGFDEVELSVTFNAEQTTQPFTSHVKNEDYQLPRKVVDGIRWALRDMIAEGISGCEGRLTYFTLGLITLRLLEETAGWLHDYRLLLNKDSEKDKDAYWDSTKVNDVNPLLDPEMIMRGVDLDTIQGAATKLLGKTPAQICENLFAEPVWQFRDRRYRILHCENILRNDLKNKLVQFQHNLRQKLMRETVTDLQTCVPFEHRRGRDGPAAKDQLVDYLTQARVTFHGTRRSLVPSIVQHGFLMPGAVHPDTKKRIPILNGSTYGQGIYTSPSASYSLLYSRRDGSKIAPTQLPGRKLLVCASIMGRTRGLHLSNAWDDKRTPVEGADSHVDPSGYEYILFNTAQIVPCYVLHIDWLDAPETVLAFLEVRASGLVSNKRANAKALEEEPESKGEQQRRKKELLARGQKFFAYGFGAVEGKRLVVEDVAEVDDDEEEYGEFQERRIDVEGGRSSFWDEGWGVEGRGEGADDDDDDDDDVPEWDGRVFEGVTALDEYVEARKAAAKRKSAV
ncbi:hypothetical protein BDV95DRAFT_610094 [Massariosphaeria phaeospora]|uniref:PARP catalytic domain-containing protein n=1 Tax=Massariosphaeria phaeospora TaxID=100035 RepID=A0A7C8MFG9_9PLEO|nr:hypothetical protein BDV95DRAFT_610094 [Massariosphaeria phaeospora]